MHFFMRLALLILTLVLLTHSSFAQFHHPISRSRSLPITLSRVPLAEAIPPLGTRTGDTCTPSTTCKFPRRCKALFGLLHILTNYYTPCDTTSINQTSCSCVPPEFVTCLGDAYCSKGERCVVLITGPPICLSISFIKFFYTIDEIAIKPPRISAPNNNTGGLTFDTCASNADCRTPRACLDAGSVSMCVPGDKACLCEPPLFDYCTQDGDCVDGEGCRLVPLWDFFGFGGVCVSKTQTMVPVARLNVTGNGTVTPLPLPTNAPLSPEDVWKALQASPDSTPEADVCIGEAHLKHLQPHQLLFQRAVYAWVLCDKRSNCATAGHIVRYKRRTMMMKSYCDLVEGGCKRLIRRVNSPASWGTVVESEGSDLQFTSLAARWGTSIEERVLRVVSGVLL